MFLPFVTFFCIILTSHIKLMYETNQLNNSQFLII